MATALGLTICIIVFTFTLIRYVEREIAKTKAKTTETDVSAEQAETTLKAEEIIRPSVSTKGLLEPY